MEISLQLYGVIVFFLNYRGYSGMEGGFVSRMGYFGDNRGGEVIIVFQGYKYDLDCFRFVMCVFSSRSMGKDVQISYCVYGLISIDVQSYFWVGRVCIEILGLGGFRE